MTPYRGARDALEARRATLEAELADLRSRSVDLARAAVLAGRAEDRLLEALQRRGPRRTYRLAAALACSGSRCWRGAGTRSSPRD